MDEAVRAALAKWPNVPHVYGWLSLDRRGKWRLQEKPISNPRITDFISRNYEHDERGAWFFQNGPQRVYVRLDYTPWILRAEAQQLITHAGLVAQSLNAALIDETGNLLVEFEKGIGLIEDRDLPALLDLVRDNTGKPANESALTQLMNGAKSALVLEWNGSRIPLTSIRCHDVAQRYGFISDPQAS